MEYQTGRKGGRGSRIVWLPVGDAIHVPLLEEKMNSRLDAFTDLMVEMQEGENIEAVLFGRWGGAEYDDEVYDDPGIVPADIQGKVLTLDEAMPLMKGWSFNGGFGAVECYAVRVWTNQRVLWVTRYDGATQINSSPRNPIDYFPDIPGGG